MMVATGGNKRRLRPEPSREFKAKHAAVKRQCALEVGNFEMHMTNPHLRMNCFRFFLHLSTILFRFYALAEMQ